MRRICARLAIAALASSGVATVTGLLAPWCPAADAPNHFTQFVLAIAVAGLALLPFAACEPAGRIRIALGLGLTGVAMTNAVPLHASLTTAAIAAHGSTDTLTIVSFNVFSRNGQLDRAARWLIGQNADLIVLQEMTRRNRDTIKRALVATYPHVHDCNCNDIVMFSRRPWIAAGGQPRTAGQPAVSWLTMEDSEGREIRVVGLRPRYIEAPYQHVAHYHWLVHHIPQLGDRLILAGDFNAAPWSWQMRRLVAAAGLRRHGTYAASWPSLLPVVLIDNLLTTPDIRAVSFTTGPFLGPDHLPIVATVALP